MEDLAKQIAAALGQLGVEGTRVWPALVAQTYVVALFWTIALPIMLVGSVIGTIYTWRWAKAGMQENPNDDALYIVAVVMVTVAACTFILAALFSWPDDLAATLYPEAATIRNLLRK